MPGKVSKNLRQGHVAQDLGELLLKRFCAVVHVPQSEDLGIDCHATLLQEINGMLHARESFYVQFKAASVRSIPYSGVALDWLKSLTLPLFVGSVDLNQSEIKLYSLHLIALSKYWSSNLERLTLYLDPPPDRSSDRTDTDAVQYLHDPILAWRISDLSSPNPIEGYFEILRRWVAIGSRSRTIGLRGDFERYSWVTNGMPELSMAGSVGGADDLPDLLNQAIPILRKLAYHFGFPDTSPSSVDFKLLFYLLARWDSQGLITDEYEKQCLAALVAIEAKRHPASRLTLEMKAEDLTP